MSTTKSEIPVRMPVLFLGHGNPMNAIEENEFVQGFRNVAKTFPKPKAILCVSAHWETRGTLVTAMLSPKTIHDFGGFPPELYQVQYPAPGNPKLASEIKKLTKVYTIELDEHDWGLDHGAWSVIKHLYPNADVPVVQLSLDYNKTPQQHFELAQELIQLRDKGVLIIGSGNLVHNLRLVDWQNLNSHDFAFDWARDAQLKINRFILDGDYSSLIQYKSLGSSVEKAIPTPEHFLPLLYTLALRNERDEISLFNDKAVGGSLTMTSVKIG
ncbi:MAG: 4,5-DOPA dioxygenase extradiol [Paludibacter sp.]|nr:4,5-DOPA dioxygenase extradiol [Paludibacter sp.]